MDTENAMNYAEYVGDNDAGLLLLWNSTKCRDGSGDKGIDSQKLSICVYTDFGVSVYLLKLRICVNSIVLYTCICVYVSEASYVFVVCKIRELSKV